LINALKAKVIWTPSGAALAQLPQHWARKKYFQWISVADESLAWTKCFVSVAGISDLISDR